MGLTETIEICVKVLRVLFGLLFVLLSVYFMWNSFKTDFNFFIASLTLFFFGYVIMKDDFFESISELDFGFGLLNYKRKTKTNK